MHRAEVSIVAGRAVGELGHLQRAESNRAGILEALQRGRRRRGDEIAADARAAGDDFAGLVIHVLVCQRHAVQRAATSALGERRVSSVGRLECLIRFDRHEGIQMRLPFRDPVETGLRHLARGNALVRDRACDRGQRHQGRFDAHRTTLPVCTTKNVDGSRSNGSVPAIAAKPSNAGPMELAMRVATSVSTGTPAALAMAWISFAVRLVIWYLPLLLARGYGPNPGPPCSKPLG